MSRFLPCRGWPVLLVCAALQLPSAVRADPPDGAAALFTDPVEVTGKGFEIKRSQIDDAYIDASAAEAASGRVIAEQDRPLLRARVLEHLILSKILLQKATANDKAKVLKTVEEEIGQARSNAPSPQAFDEEIKAKGMTLAQVRDQAVEKQLFQMILLREATNGIVITDDEVKKYAKDNPNQFKIPERVRVAHILLSTVDPETQQPLPPEKKKEKLKLAYDLKARAEKGEDFAALVKAYSDDLGSKSRGGQYTFGRGEGMVLEFEDAAFSMKTNQISDPVETQYGYHVIKLLAKIPASTEGLGAVHDYMVERAAEKGLPAYFAKIKAAADVKILDPGEAQLETNLSAPPAK